MIKGQWPKINVVNGQTAEKSRSKFLPAVAAVTIESVGVTPPCSNFRSANTERQNFSLPYRSAVSRYHDVNCNRSISHINLVVASEGRQQWTVSAVVVSCYNMSTLSSPATSSLLLNPTHNSPKVGQSICSSTLPYLPCPS